MTIYLHRCFYSSMQREYAHALYQCPHGGQNTHHNMGAHQHYLVTKPVQLALVNTKMQKKIPHKSLPKACLMRPNSRIHTHITDYLTNINENFTYGQLSAHWDQTKLFGTKAVANQQRAYLGYITNDPGNRLTSGHMVHRQR